MRGDQLVRARADHDGEARHVPVALSSGYTARILPVALLDHRHPAAIVARQEQSSLVGCKARERHSVPDVPAHDLDCARAGGDHEVAVVGAAAQDESRPALDRDDEIAGSR
jgi:hypothetical protein